MLTESTFMSLPMSCQFIPAASLSSPSKVSYTLLMSPCLSSPPSAVQSAGKIVCVHSGWIATTEAAMTNLCVTFLLHSLLGRCGRVLVLYYTVSYCCHSEFGYEGLSSTALGKQDELQPTGCHCSSAAWVHLPASHLGCEVFKHFPLPVFNGSCTPEALSRSLDFLFVSHALT